MPVELPYPLPHDRLPRERGGRHEGRRRVEHARVRGAELLAGGVRGQQPVERQLLALGGRERVDAPLLRVEDRVGGRPARRELHEETGVETAADLQAYARP